MELQVDEERQNDSALQDSTGIYVRVRFSDGSWGPVDIAVLTKESLLQWLQMDGGSNAVAENVVGILLGHGNLV